MNALPDSLLELIRRTSAEIPDAVHQAILAALEREKKGTIAESAMKIIDQNIALARTKSQPICQDTGSILFYVDGPVTLDQPAFEGVAREAVTRATRSGFLRQNSVDSLTGRNDGTNVGPGSPNIHFRQRPAGAQGRWLRECGRSIRASRRKPEGQSRSRRLPQSDFGRGAPGAGQRLRARNPGRVHWRRSREQLRTFQTTIPETA